MHWLFFSVILVLLFAILMAMFFLLKTFLSSQQTIQVLLKQNQNLTNLAAAKNLEAYSQIQAIQSQTIMKDQTSHSEVLPMDDASVAQRMMKEYQQSGIPPENALHPDDFLEFGGIEQFTGQFPEAR